MIEVLAHVHAVGLATIQDGGRAGYSRLGVPRAGALHHLRYLVATTLMSGRPDETVPAVELLAGSMVLAAATDIRLAVVGPAVMQVEGFPAANGTVIHVHGSSEVSITLVGPGPGYVVIDGWQARRTLGSASLDTFSRLGGRAIQAGDDFCGSVAGGMASRVGAFHRPLPEPGGPIRIVSTGQPWIDEFVSERWEVSGAARSGVQLSSGSFVAHRGSIASMPMVRGAVQVAPSGGAIILGPDGGVTGGYPVAGVVASVDADRVSLLAPGDVVAFRVIEAAEAFRAATEQVAAERWAVFHPTDLH